MTVTTAADDQLPVTRGELRRERQARKELEERLMSKLDHLVDLGKMTHEAVDQLLKMAKLDEERHDQAEKANGAH